MATAESEKKTVYIGFRVTESEMERIRADMASIDCLSVSKYIRLLLLRKKITIQKVHITDRSIRNQINDITAKIARIGNNYNQVVKRYNQLSIAKRKNGDPVINSRSMMYYLDKLESLTIELRQKQEEIIEKIEQIKIDN